MLKIYDIIWYFFLNLLPYLNGQNSPNSFYILEPGDKTVFEGNEVVLLCKIVKNEGPAYWTRDDVPINIDNINYSYIGSTNEGEYFLRIHKASMNRDSGRWKCRIARGSGRESKGAILNVIKKDTSIVSDIAKYKPYSPQQPLITKIKAFHYCTHDRLLVTFDFPFPITTKLIGRNQTCILPIDNQSTINFYIPYYDCGSTNSLFLNEQNSTQVKYSNHVAMSYDKATITHYFECYFSQTNGARYYTKKLGVFDLSPVPVPFKRILPADCPIEIENPNFDTHIECGWQTGFNISLSFQIPFTGKILISERGECEYSVIDQREFTLQYKFGECGAERFIEKNAKGNSYVFRNTMYIEQHCTVGSAALRVMRCELPTSSLFENQLYS